MSIEAVETALCIADIPENGVFPVEEWGEFRIRLINGSNDSEMGRVVDFAEYAKIRKHIL